MNRCCNLSFLFFSYNLAMENSSRAEALRAEVERAKATPANARLIVLLTDFGLSDPFAGILKGVIASIAPRAQVVDLVHEIPPGDVRRGAITLWQAWDYFPAGSVFVGVVDPGVGTSRRPILVETGARTFVGPDNGLISFVLEDDYQAWELRNPRFALPNPGTTFHGRDLFAPAAAYLASGVAGPEFGPPATGLTRLPGPRLDLSDPKSLRGEVLFADRFGNLLTSLGQFLGQADSSFELKPWLLKASMGVSLPRFRLEDYRLFLPAGESLGWANTFAEVPPDDCAFLVGSSGLLEIVAFRRSAAELLGLHPGDTVTLQSRGEP